MRNNIAFDIDGVVLDIVPTMIYLLDKLYNIKLKQDDIIEHNLENLRPDITKEMMRDIIGKCFAKNPRMPLYPGVFNFIYKLYSKTGDPIVFFTSRSKDAMFYTYENLKYHFHSVPFYIYFDSGKKDRARENYDYFVEDRRRNALHLATQGMKVLAPFRPWNGGMNHKNISYYDNLGDLCPYIEDYIL